MNFAAPLHDGSVWTLVEWLLLVERELLLFAVFWFLVGLADELLMDALWFVLRLDPRRRTPCLADAARDLELDGRLAVFVAAWREEEVIGTTVAQMLAAWPTERLVLYVGCYCNDPATVAAASAAAGQDARIRLVINPRAGPTTKADCLNRLFDALRIDEARRGERYRGVVLHDSEDMVHPLELVLIDRALAEVDFVQLPVRPEIPEGPHWIAGHYADEFADSHARAMVVRDALGAALPAAGVSCGFARDMLDRIADLRHGGEGEGPFAADCFTEDYELGMLVKRMGGKSCFLRVRDEDGELIGTRSYFPETLVGAVRQKTRWVHGICLQGWDRLGWNRLDSLGGWVDLWMMLRDRRGPLGALVLVAAYVLVLVEGALLVARLAYGPAMPVLAGGGNGLRIAMALCAAGAVWRLIMRYVTTAREYGPLEGLLSIARQPLANIIQIMAGRRALFAYIRSLLGARVVWEKTEHHGHPAQTGRFALGRRYPGRRIVALAMRKAAR